MTDQLAALPYIIADLRARIEALPKIEYGKGDFMEQHRRHREAARQLGDYLMQTYSARIREKPTANQITMLKISSSSTMRLIGAYQNWITAAGKRHEAQR